MSWLGRSGNTMTRPSRGQNHVSPEKQHRRRLTDKILLAFHAACDEEAVGIAGHLLEVLESVIKHPSFLPARTDRRKPQGLAAPRERLWNIRYPSPWNTNAGWIR
jgi:hypothetical protein